MSVRRSVGPSVRNLFFRWAETKTANDLLRVYELVIFQRGQEYPGVSTYSILYLLKKNFVPYCIVGEIAFVQ